MVLYAVFKYGALWLQSYFSSANIGIVPLVGMSLRAIDPATIVTATIMGQQAGLEVDLEGSISTTLLEAHALAGGNVTAVVRAIIAADRAGIDLDFRRAAAIPGIGYCKPQSTRSLNPFYATCPGAC